MRLSSLYKHINSLKLSIYVFQFSQQGSLGALETSYSDREVNTLRSEERDLTAMDRNESVPVCL